MTTTEQLIALIRERHARGLAKYGVTVDRTDLTPEEWAQHAIEELLDGAAYLMRLKSTMAEAIAEARARMEASHRMLGDAYDAARQDRDIALAKVARRDADLNEAWSRLDEAEAKVARLEATLAASRQGPANASEAPGDGGDSGRANA